MKRIPAFLQKPVCTLVALIFFCIGIYGQATITGGSGFPVGTAMSGVAYGNSKYGCVGAADYILSSADGSSWTTQKTSSFLNVTYTRVAFGNGLFAAITNDGKILTSADAVTWTQQVSGTSNPLNEIIYANGIFVIVGNNNTALSSANGTSWSSVNVGAAATDLLMTVAWGPVNLLLV
jgi:hypothetical protein